MKTLSLPTLVSLTAALSLAALPACHKPSEPSQPSAADTTRADAELRALAMTRPAGTGPVDDAIRKLEERLEKNGGDADRGGSPGEGGGLQARRTPGPGDYPPPGPPPPPPPKGGAPP